MHKRAGSYAFVADEEDPRKLREMLEEERRARLAAEAELLRRASRITVRQSDLSDADIAIPGVYCTYIEKAATKRHARAWLFVQVAVTAEIRADESGMLFETHLVIPRGIAYRVSGRKRYERRASQLFPVPSGWKLSDEARVRLADEDPE